MKARVHMAFMRDERGFTTPAAAVALLVVCSLLFVCLHGFSVGTRSGQVQYVADAGALAADNVVAEYVTAGQVVDAVLLSCSLLALGLYAVSAVASFIPGGATVAANFSNMGSKVVQARKKFASSAEKGLNAVQDVLPALIAVRSAACIDANAEASGLDYVGVAVAFPSEGVDVDLTGDDVLADAAESIESAEDDIQQAAVEQQQAQEDIDAAKQAGWLADCGADGMCMRERASKLAGLSGSSNPQYSSVDSWSFSVGIARAKAYYKARYEAEPGENYDGASDLVAESVARKRFYKYALSVLSEATVSTSNSGAELPSLEYLPRNTADVRETVMYTESIYPLSKDDEGFLTLHAYTGCSEYESGTPAGTGALVGIASGSYYECDACQFTIVTIGRVPSASTSISNGFEYYYRAFVTAANEYCEAVLANEESTAELQQQADDISDVLSQAVSQLKATRYNPQPPGRYGCVCIVYAPAVGTVSLPFLGDVSGTPARVAISAATLAADEADNQGDVITDIADGLLPESSAGSSVLHAALGAWGALLKAYTHGTDGMQSALESLLGSIPLVGTDMSQAASSAFEDALSSAGIEPADMSAYKPVVVNSSHVLERDGGDVARALLAAKDAAELYGEASVSGVSALIDELASITGIDDVLTDDGLVVATLPLSELGYGLSDVDITIAAPSDMKAQLEQALSSLSALGAAAS